MGLPLLQGRQFWNGSGWGAIFRVERQYDLAGNDTSQQYPSGRTVTYDAL